MGIGSTTKSLQLNSNTRVTVTFNERALKVYLNDTLDSSFWLPGTRYFGLSACYAGDPWSPPALAKFSNVTLSTFPETPSIPVALNGQDYKLSQGNLVGQVFVPQDFSLSFNLTPTGVIGDWASIFHCTANGENNGGKGARNPGIWFNPGNTRLYVKVDSASSGLDGAGPDATTGNVPLNATTRVTVSFSGGSLRVFFNNTQDSTFQIPGARYFGLSSCYAGDPWYAPALALLGNVTLTVL
jgi:hypothetical protein